MTKNATALSSFGYVFPFFIVIFAHKKKAGQERMKNIIENMRALCPVSDETVRALEQCLTPCHFPKKFQLVKENMFCRYAYFIE